MTINDTPTMRRRPHLGNAGRGINMRLPDLGPDGAASAWYDIIDDYETWEHWGWVTCPGFANAWGALVRLVELLDAERAAATPAPEAP